MEESAPDSVCTLVLDELDECMCMETNRGELAEIEWKSEAIAMIGVLIFHSRRHWGRRECRGDRCEDHGCSSVITTGNEAKQGHAI